MTYGLGCYNYSRTVTVGTVIVISQLPISKWHDYINEPTKADAILDGMTANAHRDDLKGESMRSKNASQLE